MNTTEFINNVRNLIGKSYDEVDCIGVIRKALGIKYQGTNWLWRSYKNSAKYKYLDSRSIGVNATTPNTGELMFKIRDNVPSGYSDKPDCYHVGVIDGTSVIHSSPSTGVRREPYDPYNWNGSGILSSKLLQPVEVEEEKNVINIDTKTAREVELVNTLISILNIIYSVLED